MSQSLFLSERHKTLKNGKGKCSVPIWYVPTGFCDNPAYGKQEPEQRRYGNYDSNHEFVPGFAPGLACFGHGGPRKPEDK